MVVDSDVRISAGYFAREAVRKAVLDGMGKLNGSWWEVKVRESKENDAIIVSITDNDGFKWRERFTGNPSEPDKILHAIRNAVALAVKNQPRQTI
jgi:hypothetical protein